MTPLTTEYRIFVTISLVVSTSFGLLCRHMEQQTRQIIHTAIFLRPPTLTASNLAAV